MDSIKLAERLAATMNRVDATSIDITTLKKMIEKDAKQQLISEEQSNIIPFPASHRRVA